MAFSSLPLCEYRSWVSSLRISSCMRTQHMNGSKGYELQPINSYFNPLLPLSLWHAAVSLSRHPEFHGSPFPVRLPHVTKSCSSLSHILHNQFLFCRVLSHMVLRDFWKIGNIFQFSWVAWFYVVLRLFGKWRQLLTYLSDEEKDT